MKCLIDRTSIAALAQNPEIWPSFNDLSTGITNSTFFKLCGEA